MRRTYNFRDDGGSTATEEALQRAAGVDPDCDHEWGTISAQGMDGTTIASTDMCALCGATRHAVSYGCQRNPGQVDRVEYAIGEEVSG